MPIRKTHLPPKVRARLQGADPMSADTRRLIETYLRAEHEIVAVIGDKIRRGLVDYGNREALNRVQTVLQRMVDDSWEYAPRMIEAQYAEGIVTEAGYQNARALTSADYSIVQRLTDNMMGHVVDASVTAKNTLEQRLERAIKFGQRREGPVRTAALESVALGKTMGSGAGAMAQTLLADLERQGITAFVDGAGRNWGLSSYCSMVTRTASREASNAGVLFADPDHDLYQISNHNSPCPICAPLEGRVFSRSGDDQNFPPLTEAFGLIDEDGPNDLTNCYLNIHPNCWHVLVQWSPDNLTERQVAEVQEFSSFESNPRKVDSRPQAQVKAYREKEKARGKLLSDYRQFQRYQLRLGEEGMPKTFQTFLKHKLANSDKYQAWQKAYREAGVQIRHPIR